MHSTSDGSSKGPVLATHPAWTPFPTCLAHCSLGCALGYSLYTVRAPLSLTASQPGGKGEKRAEGEWRLRGLCRQAGQSVPSSHPLKFLETLPQPQRADRSGNLCRNAARAPWSGAQATPHNSLTSGFLRCIFKCQAQKANDDKALEKSSIFRGRGQVGQVRINSPRKQGGSHSAFEPLY